MNLARLLSGDALAAVRDRIEVAREAAVRKLLDESLMRVAVRVRITQTCQARIAPGPEGVRHVEEGRELVVDAVTASELFTAGRAVPLDDMAKLTRCVGVDEFREVMRLFRG